MGYHRHPLSRIGLSEGKVLVNGVKIDGNNPQDPFHLVKEVLNRARLLRRTFFEDRSNRVIQDDVFTRLLTFPNVVITAQPRVFHERGALRHCRDHLGEHLRL